MFNSKIRIIIYLLGGLLLLAIGVFILFFYKPTLVVEVEPKESLIKLDGKDLANGQKLRIKPGLHHLEITSEAYIPYQKELKLGVSQVAKVSLSLRKTPIPERLTEEPIKFVVPSPDKKSLFYLANQGKTFYRMRGIEENQKREIFAITPDVLADLSEVIWSPDRALAILKKTSGETLLYDFKRYDFLHQEIYNWGKGIGDLVWAPDGSKIVYYFHPAEGEKTLIRTNKDNLEKERIYNFKETLINNPHLVWSPDNKKILLVDQGLYLFDLYYKTLEPLSQEKITEARFTPDSQRVLCRTESGLSLIELEKKKKIDLNFKTSLEKIDWFDEENLIAALPEEGKDRLYKISLANQEKKEYSYQTNKAWKLDNLILSEDKKNLFFTADDYLYRLLLEEKDY